MVEDRAVVTVRGHDIYLGPYGTKASKDRYDQVIADWLANGRRLPNSRGHSSAFTVVELVDRFLEHAKVYYRRIYGTPTSEIGTLKAALRPLIRLHSRTPVDEFGPMALKAVRQAMIDQGWSRSYINQQVNRLKSLFRWGVENEPVPAEVHQGPLAVRGLAKGRCEAGETRPVKPVPETMIEAVRLFLSQQAWAMIELQLLTGMRPGEVVILRAVDIDMSGAIWIYTPAHYKTEHHGCNRHV